MSSEISHLIKVTHRFQAVPERVFDAWLQPEKVATWMAAPARAIANLEDEIVHIKVDARVGGKFSFLIRRAGLELDHTGEYLELNRPQRRDPLLSARAKFLAAGGSPDAPAVLAPALEARSWSEQMAIVALGLIVTLPLVPIVVVRLCMGLCARM